MFLWGIGMELVVVALYIYIVLMLTLNLVIQALTNYVKKLVRQKWQEYHQKVFLEEEENPVKAIQMET